MLRILSIIEFNSFMRQPVALFWTFVYPIALLIILAFVFGGDATRTLRVASEGMPPGAALRAIEALRPGLAHTGIAITTVPEGAQADLRVVSEGQDRLRVVALQPGWQPQVLALALAADASRREVQLQMPAQDRAGYRIYLAAGVAALSIVTMALFGFTPVIVTNRAAGRLKWLAFWPIDPARFLTGFLLSRMVITVLFALALIYGAGWAYGAEAIWSAPAFLSVLLCVVLGSFCYLSLGLLLASLIVKPATANAVVNLVNLPVLFLSDFIVPLDQLPRGLAAVAEWSPLTLFVRWLRALIEDGASPPAAWLTAPLLFIIGLVAFFAAVRLFRISDN